MCFPAYFLIFTLRKASSLIITGRDLSVVTSSAEVGQMIFTEEVKRSKSKQPKEGTKTDTAGGLPSIYAH